jgi:hypothetical protein
MVFPTILISSSAAGAGVECGRGPVGDDPSTRALEGDLDAPLAVGTMAVLVVDFVMVLRTLADAVARSDARSSASMSSKSSAVYAVAGSTIARRPFLLFFLPISVKTNAGI